MGGLLPLPCYGLGHVAGCRAAALHAQLTGNLSSLPCRATTVGSAPCVMTTVRGRTPLALPNRAICNREQREGGQSIVRSDTVAHVVLQGLAPDAC